MLHYWTSTATASLDLYLTNGWRNDGPKVLERGRNRLYRNLGDATFEDVTEAIGHRRRRLGDGSGGGRSQRRRPPRPVRGPTSRRTCSTSTRAIAPSARWRIRRGSSAGRPGRCSSTPDTDGDEDLFVGGYVECTLEEVLNAEPELEWEGLQVMRGPLRARGRGQSAISRTAVTGRSSSAREGCRTRGATIASA